MDEEQKVQLIKEINEMRKRRLQIKNEMQALSDRREGIYDLSFKQPSQAQSYASSTRRESDAERVVLKEVTRDLKRIETKKQDLINEIVNEINQYRNQQMPDFLSVQNKQQKTRTEMLNLIKQLSSALLELKPNDKLADEFKTVAAECTDKSASIVNKQRDLAQAVDEMFNLMGKVYAVGEDAWNNRISDAEGLETKFARRRTSDLPTF